MKNNPRTHHSSANKVGRKAAIYARTSREFIGEERVSIPQQLAAAEDLIADPKQHLSRAATFIDENRSGKLPPEQWGKLAPHNRYGKPTRQRRAGFTQLIEAILTGKVKAVVCRKRNRLMRGFQLHREFWQLCKDRQIKVYCTHETSIDADSSDETQEFSADIQALIAEYLLKQISSDIRAAKKYLKDKGRKSAPVRSIGYDDIKGGSRINPEQKPIVTTVFQMFIEGANYNQIATHCNTKWNARTLRHPGVTRKHFTTSTILKMLSNPAYIGMSRNTNNELIPSLCYDPLIDVETYRKAQERLAGLNHARSGKRYTPHLLGGILTCKQCGSPLNCKIQKHHKTREMIDHVYQCVNTECKRGDKAAGIRETEYLLWADRFLSLNPPAEEINSEQINELIVKRSNIQQNLDALLDDAERPYESSKTREKTYRDALTKLDRHIDDLRQRVKRSSDTNKSWQHMDVIEQRQRIRELVQSITVSHRWVILRFNTNIPFHHAYYTELLIDEDADEAEKQTMLKMPRAFPIMGIRGNGTNFRKVLAPPSVFRIIFEYVFQEVHGEKCLVPNWREAYYADGKQELIRDKLDMQFNLTDSTDDAKPAL